MTISILDVQRLARGAPMSTRVATAAKLARAFDDELFSDEETVVVFEIFRLIARDIDVEVRKALAVTLKANPWLPSDVALTLAADLDEVALPMLECSLALTDPDLLTVITQQHNIAKMRAIAARPIVGGTVLQALIEHGDASVAAVAAANSMSCFDEATLDRTIDRFGQRAEVNEPLARRHDLPAVIAERLLTYVGEGLGERLVARYRLDPARVSSLMWASRERATLNVARTFGAEGLKALISQLKQTGNLSPTLIQRAALLGEIRFFEQALASRATVPLAIAAEWIRDPVRIDVIWRRGNLPQVALTGVKAALEAHRAPREPGGKPLTEEELNRVIDAVATAIRAAGTNVKANDLETLIASIGELATKHASA